MNLLLSAKAVFLKDLKVELHSKQVLLFTFAFSVLTVVLCAFAFDSNGVPDAQAGSGSLWVAICFSGVLAIGRIYSKEREMSVWTALMHSPASKKGIYLGKMAGLSLFMSLVAIFLIPVVELFFGVPLFSVIHIIVPVVILGIVGFCAVGAFFGAMTVRTRQRDLVLAVVLFPLVTPLMIFCTMATEAALLGVGISVLTGFGKLIAGLDVLFLALGIWLFEEVTEE